MKLIEQADRHSPSNYHRELKRVKRRYERRRARRQPDCAPAYNRYRGYEN